VLSFWKKTKKFNLHIHFWAIENFQLPSNGVGVLDGDQNSLVVVNQLPFDNGGMSDGDQNFSIAKKGGHVTCFWKALDEGFCKRCHKPTFYCNKNNWLPWSQ
jgi:hypothetical protein